MTTVSKSKLIQKNFTEKGGREFTVSYYRIVGAEAGPTLTLISGQHGMEHSGPNILRELIRDIDPALFKGTLQICPCANPLALELDYEFYPEGEELSKLDGYYYSIARHDYCIYDKGRDKRSWFNMNRLWNRNIIHGVTGEIAEWLWQEIVINSNVLIDLHCMQSQKPLIFNHGAKNIPWAKCFGAEVIIECNTSKSRGTDDYYGHNLTKQANTLPNAYAFCVEFSKQHGLKQNEYPLGRQGIDNIMKAMGMIEGDIIHKRPVHVIEFGGPINLRAKESGQIRYYFELYDEVKEGDKIYEIWNPQTLEVVETGYSPINGIVGTIGYKPNIKTGEMLAFVSPVTTVAKAGVVLDKPKL
jgi:predicted deacylase